MHLLISTFPALIKGQADSKLTNQRLSPLTLKLGGVVEFPEMEPVPLDLDWPGNFLWPIEHRGRGIQGRSCPDLGGGWPPLPPSWKLATTMDEVWLLWEDHAVREPNKHAEGSWGTRQTWGHRAPTWTFQLSQATSWMRLREWPHPSPCGSEEPAARPCPKSNHRSMGEYESVMPQHSWMVCCTRENQGRESGTEFNQPRGAPQTAVCASSDPDPLLPAAVCELQLMLMRQESVGPLDFVMRVFIPLLAGPPLIPVQL